MMGPTRSRRWEPYRPPVSGQAEHGEPSTLDTVGAVPDDEEVLWRSWFERRDPQVRSALIERNIPYATALAAKLYGVRGQSHVPFDEYRQFAMVGLIQSVDRFRPDGGAQFKTFATQRIRGAILNGLQHLSEAHEQSAARRRILAERAASLRPERLATDPTARLLAELHEIGMGVALGVLLEGTPMLLGPEDALPDAAYAHVEMRQLHRRLWETVVHLRGREREVIQMHYGDGKSFGEIAGTMKLTKGRVSQLHGQAVSRLRALMSEVVRCDVAY